MNAVAGSPLYILLAGVLIMIVFGRFFSARVKGTIAFASGILALASILYLSPTLIAGQNLELTISPWLAESPFSLHIDGLSLVFALMATGIGSAILFYCIDYMAHEQSTTRFYALMLTFITGLLCLVMARSLLMAYLSWEVIGLCSYFLVGFWYQNTAATRGAQKVLLMTHIPGYALLIAILILYHNSGTFLWTDPALAAQLNTGIFLLILIAAMAKSVLFPLHTWIPEAMNAPTPVSALLHSACYVKAGVYLIARLYSITPWEPSWNIILMALGCVTMIVGAFFALVQTDLKRLLAFSTISQLGYILTAFGIGTPLGALAGAFYVFSHGLFKGTLFLCAGAIQHAAGTRDMRQLGGLAEKMPGTFWIWLVAAAAIVGVPLSNGFVAKWLLFDAALEAGSWGVVIVAWLVSTFTAFYILKATVSVFFGEPSEHVKSLKIEDASPRMLGGMGVLAFGCLLFGIAPQALIQSVAAPAVSAMKFGSSTTLTFFGLHTASAGAPVTAGALLAIAALLVVGLIVLARRPNPQGVSVYTGGDPLPEGNTLNSIDFSEFAESAFQPVLRGMDPDPLYLGVGKAIQRLAGWLNNAASGLERQPLVPVLGIAALIFLIIWLM